MKEIKKDQFDRAEFWNNKILGWEEKRYRSVSEISADLLNNTTVSGKSLIYRRYLSVQILVPHIRDKNILELGCGSGQIAEGLIAAGAKSYLGVDFAESAIEYANSLAKEKGYAANAKFLVGNTVNLPDYKPDIVFSLGLIDWLSDPEITALFEKMRNVEFLHSISEKRGSLAQFAHRLFCQISYGYRTQSYVPRYMDIDGLSSLTDDFSGKSIDVLRHPSMSFGCLLTSLPIDKDFTEEFGGNVKKA